MAFDDFYDFENTYGGVESQQGRAGPGDRGEDSLALRNRQDVVARQREQQAQAATRNALVQQLAANPVTAIESNPSAWQQVVDFLTKKNEAGIPNITSVMPAAGTVNAIVSGAPVVAERLNKLYDALPGERINPNDVYYNEESTAGIGAPAINRYDDLFSRPGYITDRGEDYVPPSYGAANGQYYDTASGTPVAVPFEDVLTGQQDEAMLRVLQHIAQQGLDADTYGGQFRTELEGVNVPEGTTDFTEFFPQNIGQLLENTITERTRNEFGQRFEEFAPTGFEFDKFASTADDAIIDDILSKRYGEALSPLNNAQARGNLSDQGYNFGVGQLNDQRAGATTTLGETGTSILDRYRGNLTDIATEGRLATGNYTLGQDFDPNTYRDRIDTTAGELSGNLRGDITNAIGPNPLFDTSTALQKAGVAQGAVNETRPLYDVLARRSEARSGQRGLGTQGVF